METNVLLNALRQALKWKRYTKFLIYIACIQEHASAAIMKIY